MGAAQFSRNSGTVLALAAFVDVVEMWRAGNRRCIVVTGADDEYRLQLLEDGRIIREEPMASVDDIIITAREWRYNDKAPREPI